jgi:hypothetical protein
MTFDKICVLETFRTAPRGAEMNLQGQGCVGVMSGWRGGGGNRRE